MTNSQKITLGDVFELKTNRGNIMLQYVYDRNIEFILVFRNFYTEIPENIESFLKNQERFVLQFPIKAANKKKIVRKIGNADFEFVLPLFMKHRSFNKDGERGWTIVHTETYKMRFTKELTEDEKFMHPWGIWNDTLLIERLEKDWQLSD